jgi:hypothetical protein
VSVQCSGSRAEGVVDTDGSITWDAPLIIDAGPNTLEVELTAVGPAKVKSDLILAAIEFTDATR